MPADTPRIASQAQPGWYAALVDTTAYDSSRSPDIERCPVVVWHGASDPQREPEWSDGYATVIRRDEALLDAVRAQPLGSDELLLGYFHPEHAPEPDDLAERAQVRILQAFEVVERRQARRSQ
jgi:hypothetical protein